MMQNSYDNSPTLYLIPTPIGNLEDITYRAVRIFKEVYVIFSEDTRVTSILLKEFDINKKLISLHEHNEEEVKEKVLKYLKEGFSIGLVTDRGTPVISDPGYKTVRYVMDNGYNVVCLPGATAMVPALVCSGIPPSPFLFYGFLNSKDSKKREELNYLKEEENTMIFYEAPHRINKTLDMMLEIFGDREISISREITKKFESVYRGKISEVMKIIPLKGEFVIVVSGEKSKNNINDLSIKDNVNLYIKAGYDVMSAIKKTARERGVSKSEIYSEYHKESE